MNFPNLSSGYLALLLLAGAGLCYAGQMPKNQTDCIAKAVVDASMAAEKHEKEMAAASAIGAPMERVKALLGAMAEGDQSIRNVAIEAMSTKCQASFQQPEMAPITKIGRAIGEHNRRELKSILDSVGWPVISVYGAASDKAAFLVAQHADREPALQLRALELLTPLVLVRETDGENYALLFDRIQVNAGKPQRFGSQGRCDGQSWVPDAIDSPADVDRRRASVGLEPMRDYQVRVSKFICR